MIVVSLVNYNIIFACTCSCLNCHSSNVKQFNLTDIQYIVESLLLLTWLSSRTLFDSSFCIQVRDTFVASVLVE